VINKETSVTTQSQPVEGIEIDKVAEYNGQPLFNLDLESLEEKPWRKPGITYKGQNLYYRRGRLRLFQLWI
jgi:hypothetical protein